MRGNNAKYAWWSVVSSFKHASGTPRAPAPAIVIFIVSFTDDVCLNLSLRRLHYELPRISRSMKILLSKCKEDRKGIATGMRKWVKGEKLRRLISITCIIVRKALKIHKSDSKFVVCRCESMCISGVEFLLLFYFQTNREKVFWVNKNNNGHS